jgi:hypothetical protein
LLHSPSAAEAHGEAAQKMMAANPAKWGMEREQVEADA